MCNWALQHLLSTIELYRMQLKANRRILHEHPNGTTNWYLPETLEPMADHDREKFTGHMCQFDTIASDQHGEGRVKKPRGFLTSSHFIRGRPGVKGVGGHRHVHLLGGKAKL